MRFLLLLIPFLSFAQIPGDVVRDSQLFDPREISGLVAWWDANYSFAGYTNGTAVSNWVSRVNGHTATNSTAAQMPTVTNITGIGYAVRCDNSDDQLFFNIPQTYSNFTAIHVKLPCYAQENTVSRYFSTYDGTAGDGIGMNAHNLGYKTTIAVDGIAYADYMPYNITNFFGIMWHTRLNNKHSVLYTNANYSLVVASNSATIPLPRQLKGAFGVQYFGMESLIYTNALSTLQRQQVERYLSTKWSIPITQ